MCYYINFFEVSLCLTKIYSFCGQNKNPTAIEWIELWQSNCCPYGCIFPELMLLSNNDNNVKIVKNIVNTTFGTTIEVGGWRFTNLHLVPGDSIPLIFYLKGKILPVDNFDNDFIGTYWVKGIDNRCTLDQSIVVPNGCHNCIQHNIIPTHPPSGIYWTCSRIFCRCISWCRCRIICWCRCW